MSAFSENVRQRHFIRGAILVATVLVIAWPLSASAVDSGFSPPLPMNNRTPFTQLFIAPAAPDTSQSVGHHQLSGHIDLSSHSLIQATGDSAVELDGETLRIALDWQYRPSDRWIVSVEVPWVSHRGGLLDNVIDQWHDLTGLPDGERPGQPTNRLFFGFRNTRQTLVTTADQQHVGDIQVSAAFQLSQKPPEPDSPIKWQRSSWVQLGVKLPTGRAESLSGSEGTDLALSFHHNRLNRTARRPWSFGVDAYWLHVERGRVIDSAKQTQWLLNVRGAVHWTDRISPELQLRYRSAAYNSPLAALGGDSLGLDAGVTIRSAKGYWKLGLSEDLDIDSAPDVGFYLQYTYR